MRKNDHPERAAGRASGVPQGFPHPEPVSGRPRIRPVFLPFAGCPSRCSFCNQHAVTGNPPRSLDEIYHSLEAELEADQRPMELAFYGGTFTALPAPWPRRFLELAARLRASGRVTRVRCSTRPDAVSPGILTLLADHGLDLVELGIQSFHDPCLLATRRGYDAATALDACERVRGAGFDLGLQLMPGMPMQNRMVFDEDVRQAVEVAPECVRLYPCTVLDGTPMAMDWEAGRYPPWTLEATVEALGAALLRLWDAGIHVIRMGLPPEPGLGAHVLAGPTHPALGQLARSEALYHYIARCFAAEPEAPASLTAPERYRSDLLGHKRCMIPRYAALGLAEESLHFDGGDTFRFGR